MGIWWSEKPIQVTIRKQKFRFQSCPRPALGHGANHLTARTSISLTVNSSVLRICGSEEFVYFKIFYHFLFFKYLNAFFKQNIGKTLMKKEKVEFHLLMLAWVGGGSWACLPWSFSYQSLATLDRPHRRSQGSLEHSLRAVGFNKC